MFPASAGSFLIEEKDRRVAAKQAVALAKELVELVDSAQG
jgi:hypothetical protein